jgi:hypothetical protein
MKPIKNCSGLERRKRLPVAGPMAGSLEARLKVAGVVGILRVYLPPLNGKPAQGELFTGG